MHVAKDRTIDPLSYAKNFNTFLSTEDTKGHEEHLTAFDPRRGAKNTERRIEFSLRSCAARGLQIGDGLFAAAEVAMFIAAPAQGLQGQQCDGDRKMRSDF